MISIKFAIPLALSCMLTGCFQVQGVHYIHRYGESDDGAYRITMNRLTYAALQSDDHYSDLMKQLHSWSRPTTRTEGDSVLLEDNTGNASMEHFYDSYHCSAAPLQGYMDCRFAFKIDKEMGALPDWSIDWEVVLQPDMQVIQSNHQRTRRQNGLDHLIWYYDGNRTSEASVDFTVRVPKATAGSRF